MSNNSKLHKKQAIGPVGIVLIIVSILIIGGIIIYVITHTKPCPPNQILQTVGGVPVCEEICKDGEKHWPGTVPGTITKCSKCPPGQVLHFENPNDPSSSSSCVNDCPKNTIRCPPYADYSSVDGINNSVNLANPSDDGESGAVCLDPSKSSCVWNSQSKTDSGNAFACPSVGNKSINECQRYENTDIFKSCCGDQNDLINPTQFPICNNKEPNLPDKQHHGWCVGCDEIGQQMCGYSCCPSLESDDTCKFDSCCVKESVGESNTCCPKSHIIKIKGKEQPICCNPKSILKKDGKIIGCCGTDIADAVIAQDGKCSEPCGQTFCPATIDGDSNSPSEICQIFDGKGSCIPTKCVPLIDTKSINSGKIDMDYGGDCYQLTNWTSFPQFTYYDTDKQGKITETTYPLCGLWDPDYQMINTQKPYLSCGETNEMPENYMRILQFDIAPKQPMIDAIKSSVNSKGVNEETEKLILERASEKVCEKIAINTNAGSNTGTFIFNSTPGKNNGEGTCKVLMPCNKQTLENIKTKQGDDITMENMDCFKDPNSLYNKLNNYYSEKVFNENNKDLVSEMVINENQNQYYVKLGDKSYAINWNIPNPINSSNPTGTVKIDWQRIKENDFKNIYMFTDNKSTTQSEWSFENIPKNLDTFGMGNSKNKWYLPYWYPNEDDSNNSVLKLTKDNVGLICATQNNSKGNTQEISAIPVVTGISSSGAGVFGDYDCTYSVNQLVTGGDPSGFPNCEAQRFKFISDPYHIYNPDDKKYTLCQTNDCETSNPGQYCKTYSKNEPCYGKVSFLNENEQASCSSCNPGQNLSAEFITGQTLKSGSECVDCNDGFYNPPYSNSGSTSISDENNIPDNCKNTSGISAYRQCQFSKESGGWVNKNKTCEYNSGCEDYAKNNKMDGNYMNDSDNWVYDVSYPNYTGKYNGCSGAFKNCCKKNPCNYSKPECNVNDGCMNLDLKNQPPKGFTCCENKTPPVSGEFKGIPESICGVCQMTEIDTSTNKQIINNYKVDDNGYTCLNWARSCVPFEDRILNKFTPHSFNQIGRVADIQCENPAYNTLCLNPALTTDNKAGTTYCQGWLNQHIEGQKNPDISTKIFIQKNNLEKCINNYENPSQLTSKFCNYTENLPNDLLDGEGKPKDGAIVKSKDWPGWGCGKTKGQNGGAMALDENGNVEYVCVELQNYTKATGKEPPTGFWVPPNVFGWCASTADGRFIKNCDPAVDTWHDLNYEFTRYSWPQQGCDFGGLGTTCSGFSFTNTPKNCYNYISPLIKNGNTSYNSFYADDYVPQGGVQTTECYAWEYKGEPSGPYYVSGLGNYPKCAAENDNCKYDTGFEGNLNSYCVYEGNGSTYKCEAKDGGGKQWVKES